MPVPLAIGDLSILAGGNSPPGTESPSTTDDYLRAHASFIAKLRDEKYWRDNILGIVSQSAGVPTGALMEHGISAAGEYWRYAGGQQITLTPALFMLDRENFQSFGLPAAFASTPFHAVSIGSVEFAAYIRAKAVTAHHLSNSSVYLLFNSEGTTLTSATSGASTYVYVTSFGRWY